MLLKPKKGRKSKPNLAKSLLDDAFSTKTPLEIIARRRFFCLKYSELVDLYFC